MQYVVALADLYVGNAKAHNEGDLVPAENVEANGWQDFVAKPNTKAAKDVQSA